MRRLSNAAIRSIDIPGSYSDGDGLFLKVRSSGSKSWICRVQKHGLRRDIGLGSAKKISLAIARKRAAEIRTWMELGLDPIFERRRAQGIPTFKEAAHKVYEANAKTWRNSKHRLQWIRTLEQYVFPKIGNVQVSQITGPMIRDVLAVIWLEKPETARRVRQRMGMVLDWAYAMGYRESEAPMRSVTKGLPRQPKKNNHYAAMPFTNVPAFVQKLRARESFSRLALEFAIFTASRSGEVRGAKWHEIDFDAKLWTICGDRMKAGRDHVIPLTPRALEILDRCSQLRIARQQHIFPGSSGDRQLSDMTLSKLLKEMKEPYTVHGYRSSFRDWVSETTDFQDSLAEAALAHAVKDKTEAAYRRGNLLEKRRDLMRAWAEFCG